MAEIAAMVLAAGRASRFAPDGEGPSKVLAKWDGLPLVGHVVAAAVGSRTRPIVVVTGRDAASVNAALAERDVVFVHNRLFADGMAGSITAGLAALPTTAEGVVILLADMPRVRSQTIDLLIDAFDRDRPDAVVPCHDGQRGNPVLISRSVFPALRRLRGDRGARAILVDGSARVANCVVDDPGVLVDVDTREALDGLGARPNPNTGFSRKP